jgi:hypothetical protein
MDTQEYREIIAILKEARGSIEAVLDDLTDRPDVARSLKRVVADLEKAIQTYKDKLNAPPS